MDAKENALRIIRFDHPHRVTGGPPVHGLSYHGANHEGYQGGGHDCPVGSQWVDIWGTRWHKEHAGVMGFPRGHPLADVSALRSYAWPDPDDPRLVSRIYHHATDFDRDACFLAGSHRDTLWEKAYMLVGMENLMEYFHTEPHYAREVLHRIMDFQLSIARHYLKLGVEMVFFTDDLGTQRGPLLGPHITYEFLIPEYRRLFDLYRAHHVLISFHSCGNVDWLIDTFIDLGVNILNPIQATANDLDRIRARSAGKMALHGGVSSATLMAGPVERIEAEVRLRLLQLGREGGYFCSPDQGMPFPAAHLEAMAAALERNARYPLTGDPA